MTIGELLNYEYKVDERLTGQFSEYFIDSTSVMKIIGEKNLAGKLDTIKPVLDSIGALNIGTFAGWTNTSLLCKDGEDEPVLAGFVTADVIEDTNMLIVKYNIAIGDRYSPRNFIVNDNIDVVTNDTFKRISYEFTKREVDGPNAKILIVAEDEEEKDHFYSVENKKLIPVLKDFSGKATTISSSSSLDMDFILTDQSDPAKFVFYVINPDLNPILNQRPLKDCRRIGDYLMITDTSGKSALYIPGIGKCIPEEPMQMYKFDSYNYTNYCRCYAFKDGDNLIIYDDSKDGFTETYGSVWNHVLYEGKGNLTKDENATNLCIIEKDNTYGLIMGATIIWCTDYRLSKYNDKDQESDIVYYYKGDKVKMHALGHRSTLQSSINFVDYAQEFDGVQYTMMPYNIIRSGDKETFISNLLGVVCLKIDRKHLGGFRGAGYDDLYWFDECYPVDVDAEEVGFIGRIGDKKYKYNQNTRKLDLIG